MSGKDKVELQSRLSFHRPLRLYNLVVVPHVLFMNNNNKICNDDIYLFF